MAELWFESEPEIDRDRLLAQVRERLPESELKPDGPVVVAHMRYLHTYADGETGPIVTAILEATRMSGRPATSATRRRRTTGTRRASSCKGAATDSSSPSCSAGCTPTTAASTRSARR